MFVSPTKNVQIMKKFLFISCMLFIASAIVPSLSRTNAAQAQIVTTLTPTAADDTLTNGDTANIYISTGLGSTTTAVADNISRSIEILVTKLSGTAAGSVKLQGTVDGTNWVTISTDTLTNTTSNVFVYNMRASSGDLLYKQYRAQVITSGTVSAIPKVYYLRRSN
jgi:hypothetical protein